MFPDSDPLPLASNLVRSLTAAVIAQPVVETFSQTEDCPSHRTLQFKFHFSGPIISILTVE